MMFNARRLKMNRSAFSALFVAAALAGNLHNATAQTINSTAQTASPRVVASRKAPATAAKPGAITRVAPQGVPQPTGLNPQGFNANLPRMIAQPPANLQRTYSPIVRTSNPNLAALARSAVDQCNNPSPLIQRHAKLSCARWRQCINDAALLPVKETFWIQRHMKMKCAH